MLHCYEAGAEYSYKDYVCYVTTHTVLVDFSLSRKVGVLSYWNFLAPPQADLVRHRKLTSHSLRHRSRFLHLGCVCAYLRGAYLIIVWLCCVII